MKENGQLTVRLGPHSTRIPSVAINRMFELPQLHLN
jgi:hypothetical protein